MPRYVRYAKGIHIDGDEYRAVGTRGGTRLVRAAKLREHFPVSPGAAILCFCNEAGATVTHLGYDTNIGPYYPTYDDNPGTPPYTWDGSLAAAQLYMIDNYQRYDLDLAGERRQFYFKAGLMSFTAPTKEDPPIEYGLEYCKPTTRSFPEWLHTTQRTFTPPTQAQYHAFFDDTIEGAEGQISRVYVYADVTWSMGTGVDYEHIIGTDTALEAFLFDLISQGYAVAFWLSEPTNLPVRVTFDHDPYSDRNEAWLANISSMLLEHWSFLVYGP